MNTSPNMYSRVTVSAILGDRPYSHRGADGTITHTTMELHVGEGGTRVYCTAFAQNAQQIDAAKLNKGEHILVYGRLRPSSKQGERSNWVEVQEIAVGIRELEGEE
jgi:hypothetical protein